MILRVSLMSVVRCLLIGASISSGMVATTPAHAGWKAGVATADITPDKPIWMSGYASRDHRAEATRTKLWGKVLVLEDSHGKRLAVVTLDLVGIDEQTSQRVRDQLRQKFGLEKTQIALLCSHTHCGPVVGNNLLSMFTLKEEDIDLINEYTTGLIDELVVTVGKAISDLAPAELGWATGHADFAVNRRKNKEAEVPTLRAAGQLLGPSDHEVPVLKVQSGPQIKALVFGYACHATTLSFFEWCGDYPGYAMLDLEEKHPGAVAMFWAGCGADQNPLPRRTVELAQSYGQQLSVAVQEAIAGDVHAITGDLETRYDEPELPFANMLTKEQIEANLTSTNTYEAGRARMLKQELDATGTLKPTYAYPVQSWKLGDGPLWVTLGGEVVVDYSIRLKTELRAKPGVSAVWVAGYANDVMAYIPSLRVLKEGGYEGGGAMLYYGRPGIWGDTIEQLIVETVHSQADAILLPSSPSAKPTNSAPSAP